MTVNCWLNRKGTAPGAYPSGGPISRVCEIWNFCAPCIDIYGPDIYLPDFQRICEEYTRRGEPLYIPECPGTDTLAFEEGQFENGQWKRGRRLNGDEFSANTFTAKEPVLLRIKLFSFA